MGTTVPWRRHVRWRTWRSTNAESESIASSNLSGTHSTRCYRDSGAILGASQIYETLLRTGKAKKVCTACNRHLDSQEMTVFENYVRLIRHQLNSVLTVLRFA